MTGCRLLPAILLLAGCMSPGGDEPVDTFLGDLAKTPQERCADGQGEYDADRNFVAGALLVLTCMG